MARFFTTVATLRLSLALSFISPLASAHDGRRDETPPAPDIATIGSHPDTRDDVSYHQPIDVAYAAGRPQAKASAWPRQGMRRQWYRPTVPTATGRGYWRWVDVPDVADRPRWYSQRYRAVQRAGQYVAQPFAQTRGMPNWYGRSPPWYRPGYVPWRRPVNVTHDYRPSYQYSDPGRP
jgi:hypothetical protein